MTRSAGARSNGMKTAILLIASALLLTAPAAAAAEGAADAKRPFCPKRSLDLRSGERLDAARLVGKTVRRAKAIAERHECTVRVVRRNGVPLPVTDDYLTNRINVAVRDGIVKRIVGVF